MMTGTPSYYAWCPSAEKKDVIGIYLTAGRFRRGPEGGRPFFESVLEAVGIGTPLHAWGVHPFTTSYFSGKDWEACWDARFLFDDEVGPVPGQTGGVPVPADPEQTVDPGEFTQVRVLADFGTRKEATACVAALKERNKGVSAGDVYYSRFVVRDLGRSHKQVRCDVGSAGADGLSRLIAAAEEAQAICERLGGSTRAPA
jgi:hypothetical protein